MDFIRNVGSDNDSFIDDNSLTVSAAPQPDGSFTPTNSYSVAGSNPWFTASARLRRTQSAP